MCGHSKAPPLCGVFVYSDAGQNGLPFVPATGMDGCSDDSTIGTSTTLRLPDSKDFLHGNTFKILSRGFPA